MYGTLPGLLKLPGAEEKTAFLRAYALTYLREEVWAEHLVRKLDPFRRFMEVAAQCNGEIVNFKSEATADGQYRTILKSTLEIYRAGPQGELVERIPFPATEDLCRQPRTDYFHSYEFTIPKRITLGASYDFNAKWRVDGFFQS